MNELSRDRLQELVSYNPETGEFRWLKVLSNRVRVGQIARPNGRKRVNLSIEGRTYPAPRLAWLIVTGAWPAGVVDHINGDTTDNRWSNLRDVPQKVNAQNIRSPHRDNRTGFQGVVRKPSGKFSANICVAGRQTNIGLFLTAEEAHAAYVRAKRVNHRGCTL